MLAARASTARNAQRLARSFATVVDTTGVKVAAVDYNQPTASVTVLVKAGSRFEPKNGVAHALKNFAFKVSHIYAEMRAVILNVLLGFRALVRDLLLGLFVKANFTEAFCTLLLVVNTWL